MTWQDIMLHLIYACRGCKRFDEENKICKTPFLCIREATPEILRKLNLAFLCEECGDMPVTNLFENLFEDENDNEYLCNNCKGINDEGERLTKWKKTVG